MLLEEFVETIKVIRNRMVTHRDTLRENQIRTRMALVEPVLRALGWDTGDPAMVQPNHTATGPTGKTLAADLLLSSTTEGQKATGKKKTMTNRAAIDVLPLNHDPAPDQWDNLTELCQETKTIRAVVTDGNYWEIRKVGGEEDRGPTILHIDELPAYRSAIALIELWSRGD